MNPIRIKLALALGLSAGLLRAQAQDPRALIQHAVELQQSGQDEAAVTAYREFLKLRPDEAGAHSNLGVVLTRLGRYDEAISEYETAARLLPGDPRIILNLALAYSKSGRLAEARDRLSEAHATAPGNAQITMLLADVDLRLGQHAEVISLLEPLANDDAGLSVAYLLGTAYIRSGEVKAGQVLLDRILRNGDSAEARFLLGEQMFESGDYPSAVAKFKSAIESNPKLPELQSHYGQALLMTGDPDGASAAFRAALDIDPNDFRANLGLGEIEVQRGHVEPALPLLTRGVTLRPADMEALASLGHLLTLEQKWQEARARLQAAVERGATSAAVHRDLAVALAHLNQPRLAQQESAKASEMESATRAQDSGPKPGDIAPDFKLNTYNGDGTVQLSSFRAKSPVVLVFGSYSCPNFRAAAPALKSLEAKYGQDVPFFLVYVREAHTSATWETQRNDRDGVHLSDATSLPDKQQHAAVCVRSLHLPFPALVDGMDGAVEKAYAAWPSRAVMINREGRIVFDTRLTELDFHPDRFEAVLQHSVAAQLSRATHPQERKPAKP